MKTSFAFLAVLLLGAAPAIAQVDQPRPYSPRQAEIGRRNQARRQASRLLFGPRGIPALARPSDPWNYNRPRSYRGRPNDFANRARPY